MSFDYEGPDELRAPVTAALGRVVDPELAMSITDIGLVYGIRVQPGAARVRMTMTSAACPVSDLIVDDLHHELDKALGGGSAIDVQLCWEPPWTSDMMSERARRFMGG